MNRSSRWWCLPLLAFLAAPALGQDKKPAEKKDADKKLVAAGKLAGEIVHVEPSKHSIRVKVGYPELNMGEYQALLRDQASLATARSAQQIQSIRNSIAQRQARLYTTKYTEIPVEAAENCVVRLPLPKSAFDEMGNVKKLSPKELAKLRGKDKLFDGEFSDLTNGQIVEVTLVKNKPKPGQKKDDLEENKPQASRIAVLKQPKPGS
jgi:hypothetical protein